MCGVEWMEGVLIMAASTKALLRMDMSISGALRTQFMMITVSGTELSSFSEWWSAVLLFWLWVLSIIQLSALGSWLLALGSFWERSSRIPVSFEEQIMSREKYPSNITILPARFSVSPLLWRRGHQIFMIVNFNFFFCNWLFLWIKRPPGRHIGWSASVLCLSLKVHTTLVNGIEILQWNVCLNLFKIQHMGNMK